MGGEYEAHSNDVEENAFNIRLTNFQKKVNLSPPTALFLWQKKIYQQNCLVWGTSF
jgi:hypothetical protein